MSGAGPSLNGGEEVKRVVERVLDKRIVGKKVQYFIRWKSFEDDDDKTWEPEDTLGCPELIAEFEKELKQMETKKSLEVKSLLQAKDGAAGHASNMVSGCNQDPAVNFEGEGTGYVGELGKGVAGSKEPRKEPDGIGKKLGTGTSSSAVTKELEPLLNPLILTNLFSMVQPKTLATCRRVCNTWKENSLSLWRSASTLQFLYLNKKVTLSPCSSATTRHLDNATTLNEFLECWDQDFSAKPYQRFHLKDWKLFEPSVGKAKRADSLKCQIDRFWDLIGPSMKALTLTDCKFSSALEFRKIIFQSCPNLEVLVMHSCTYLDKNTPRVRNYLVEEYTKPACGEQLKLRSLTLSYDSSLWSSMLPVSHFELLSHFPALTSLQISHPPKPGTDLDWDARMWIKAIKIIRSQDERKLSLKNFQIDGLTSSHAFIRDGSAELYFELLRELEVTVTVEAVLFEVSSLSAGEDMIEDLISFHGRTLQKITARENSYENIPNFRFPYNVQLNNLQTLEMCDRFCQNMEFIKYTPNLEELKIRQRGYSRVRTQYNKRLRETHVVSNTLAYENSQLAKLKKLELNCKVSDGGLMGLSKCSPNVEELTMSANDAQFGVICKQWSQLVHLHLIDVGLTDAGIIGTGLELGIANGVEGLQAPITLLNGLKCLKIREGPFNGIKLTDASAVNGFLVLPQLEILHFNARETMFGNATKAALCAKIPNCKLHAAMRRCCPVGCPCCEVSKQDQPNIECDW